MINLLEVHYFQSWKFASFMFSPGVNVIKGPSHSGKSSIIRAIKWAVQNKPRGDSFRSHFADKKDDTKVVIDFNDNYVVRGKGRTNNYYTINEDTFEAMRADVPEEIQQIFGMNDLNIQSQHDPYFLIQDTPGAVAKKLNELLGLEIIDEKQGKVNTIINKTEIALNTAKENEKDNISELERYKDLDRFEIMIDEVRALQGGYEQAVSKRESLENLQGTIKEIRVDIKALEDWLTVKNRYEELEVLAKQLGKLQSKRYSLQSILASIRKEGEAIAASGRYRSGLENKYKQLLEAEGVCPLCGQKIKKSTETI